MSRLVVIEQDELAALVRDAVAEALEVHAPSAPRGLLNRAEAAAYLGVTPRTVDTLRRTSGLPTRWVGDSPRFDVGELDAWSSSANAGCTSRRSLSESSSTDADSAPPRRRKGSAEKARSENRNDSVITSEAAE